MEELAVLVVSCDAYADTWRPFFTFFWKFWPDCPYTIYLGTNYKEYDDPRVKSIKVGRDVSWSESTRKMLEAVNAKYVLLCLEDYYIYDLKPDKMIEIFTSFKELNAKYMQLAPTPRPDKKVPGYPLIGEIKKGARYRTAIGLEFWNVDTFISLLRDGESAWDMENKGSDRAKDIDGFYRTWKPAVKFYNAIVRGTWQRRAVNYCRRNGVEIDTSQRPVFTRSATVWIGIKSFIRRSISRLPEPIFTRLFYAGRKTLSIFSEKQY